MKCNALALIAALCAVSVPSLSHADESLWLYTKGAETLPKGETEVRASVISKRGKADSDYIFNDIRFEAEYGLTDRLTVFGEVMVFDHDYSTTNPDLQPFFETQGGAGGRFRKTQISGFAAGMKYNILSPYKDPIGLAVTAEWDHRSRYRIDGSPIDQDALEVQLHMQKNFLDNQLVFAFSPRIEWEYRLSPGIIEREISLDITGGVSYRVAPKWYVGAEFRHQSDYLSPFNTDVNSPDFGYDPNLRPSRLPFKFGSQYQNGNYIGPSVHYASQKFWATAGVLWQVSGGGKYAFNRDGLNVDEHEKVNIGVTFGFEL